MNKKVVKIVGKLKKKPIACRNTITTATTTITTATNTGNDAINSLWD